MTLSLPFAAPFCTLAILTLAACAPVGDRQATRSAKPEPAPEARAADAPRAAPPQPLLAERSKLGTSESSPALTLNQYHRNFALHLTRINQDKVFEGTPPTPLRAIIVLEIELGRDGQVTGVRTLRAPDHGQAQLKLARESIQRAAPYPRPAVTVALGRPRIALVETWLFADAQRFQLRSLALQQSVE